ncbi:MAG: type I-C CRISPR-associated endonuclease Cas1 [Fimbriimonadaceae bacterium]|nr:MAG: type I-C CRISPR-associated endonuclease Cas1 [Fimbriimonadaceae bacterium]
MTKVFLNTLYVGTDGAYCRLENDQVFVEVPEAASPSAESGPSLESEEGAGGGLLRRKVALKVPLHHLGAIVLFGRVAASFPLLGRCATDGRALVLMNPNGRFVARVQGKTSGNVLLRKAQYDFHNDEGLCFDFVLRVVAAKLQNARQVLLRAAREGKEPSRAAFESAAGQTASLLAQLAHVQTIDEARGIEGMAAQVYFGVFDAMITSQRVDFRFDGRSRRPPRDRANCLLSFLYSLWTNDCTSALEGVGLDPQFGILHVLRPGRPGLGLDLVEEFRAIVLDRLALSLINRKQLTAEDFKVRPGGSVMLTDDGRKKLLVAYQKRKQVEVRHAMFKERVPIGLLPHVQARIMARCFRGDIPHYIPYEPQ